LDFTRGPDEHAHCCIWRRVEAPLLAQALGITASTAVRWSELAGRTFNGYVDRLVRNEARSFGS
jgi:hypothetical protein